jgi:hypothetical protein
MTRALDALRGTPTDLPRADAPAPGTEVALTGLIRQGRAVWGELAFDDVALEDAVASALALDPGAPPFRARITIRVLDGGGSAAERRSTAVE